MNNLEKFLLPTQKELFKRITKLYTGAIVRRGSYILVPGQAPVMLVAHLDTVHPTPVKTICRSDNGNILMSPEGIGGDDRCGVYALVTAHKQAPVKPWLLFTCDEEVGGVGACVFCKEYSKGKLPKRLDDLKALIEIDRKGHSDAVYYDCENEEFMDYITSKGFKPAFGSFSDISLVAPELGVAAVNLSAGYYNAHTKFEYINRKQLDNTIGKVVEIIADSVNEEFPQYEYADHMCFPDLDGRGWGRDFDVRYEKDGFNIKLIPAHIRSQYKALLDFYSVYELEEIRALQGDRAIAMLANAELGCDCYDEPDCDAEDGHA